MRKIINILKNNWVLVLIIIAGIFLRAFKPLELFSYGHDQDLTGWIIRDVLENRHLRLIGQETSSHGVFIGPLFYYLQIPFYLIANMDPAGALLLPIILGGLSIFSFYFIFSKIFGKKAGLIAALVYSVSTLIVFTDREVVPTTPVMIWAVWFFYSLWLLLKGNQKSYILIGFLLGIVWNFNLALIILSPLVLLAQILSKQKLNFKFLVFAALIFSFVMTPYFGFEIRHDFQQTKAIASSLTSQKDYIPGTSKGFGPKLDRVMQLANKNVTTIFWGSRLDFPRSVTFYSFVALFIFLGLKGIIPRNLFIVILGWQILYIGFFASNSLNLSEYYINGMNVIWIGLFGVGVAKLMETNKLEKLGWILIGTFIVLNLWSFFAREVNKSGYVERKAITSYIAKDSREHGYPCVAVSYITSPGNDFGYRYFFYLNNLHVNQSKSGSPVYTIVYPLSGVDRVDKSFGVLGLILPDYKMYTKEKVEVSCSGQNANLTDPLFGFTK